MLQQSQKKYFWLALVVVVIGLVCGFLLRWTAVRDVVLSVVEGVSVEISNEADIIMPGGQTSWLGLRIKTSVSGEEKRAFQDYSLEVMPPGSEDKYILLPSGDGENYIFPIWPVSDPGEHRFFITMNDNPGGTPLEDSVNFPGVIEKQNMYRIRDDGRMELVIDGVDFDRAVVIYHAVNDKQTGGQIIELFPELRENGGIFDKTPGEGRHVFIFRIGEQWYYTRVEIIPGVEEPAA